MDEKEIERVAKLLHEGWNAYALENPVRDGIENRPVPWDRLAERYIDQYRYAAKAVIADWEARARPPSSSR
jgi:hypothetical protein